MAGNRGKGDPMAGLLSNLGGIDPNLFNKPTMGQLKNKQQPAAVPPKTTAPAVQTDTIAAVGSPIRPEADASDSFSSRQSKATGAPEQAGQKMDDLDSFFGSAKPSAAPSPAGSYAPSPANMSSPAASLGIPNDRSELDLFGNISSSSSAQHAQHSQAAKAGASGHTQSIAVDPFDLFGEGSTVPASAAAPANQAGPATAGADDSLFGDVGGYQGSVQKQQAANQSPLPQAQEALRQPPLPARSPNSVSSSGTGSQPRPQVPRRSRSFTGSPTGTSPAPAAFIRSNLSNPSRNLSNPSASFSSPSVRSSAPPTPASKGHMGHMGSSRTDSSSSLDTTAAMQGSPTEPQQTPSSWHRPRRSSDDGRATRRGPLEEGASTDKHPDPYMHEDPYMGQNQRQNSGNLEQTAKTWLTGGQKWLKSAGKKIASAAKESATEIQKRLDAADIKLTKGKGAKIGDDGEQVPAYYQQWADRIKDMSPSRQADVLDQLGEDDRMIVQRILDQAAVRRSADGATASNQQQHVHSADDSPPPYPGSSRQKASRPSSPRHGQTVSDKSAHISRQNSQEALQQDISNGHQQQAQRGRTAADMGIFDTANDTAHSSTAEVEQAVPARPAARLQTQQPASAQPVQAKSGPAGTAAAADADFLGFSTTSQSPAEESFLPESPPAEPSGFSMDAQTAAQPTSSPAPPSADGLADFFSTSAQEPASSSYSAEDRSSTAHIDDMFSAAPKPAAVQQRPSQASSGAATAQRRGQGGASSSSAGVGAGFSGGSGPALAAPKPAAPRPAVPTSMIDFGDEAAMLAQNPDLYQGLQAVEGEPELRKQLREKRLREMHQRMQAQLAEKQARDSAESDEKEQKVDLRNRVVKPKIEAWQQGKKDNIRALLSTLHTVLWEGSGWNPPNMTDLVETNKVKKQYMKANLIVHPDKVKQKGGTVEQIVIADMAFDALKTAWAKFESGELRK